MLFAPFERLTIETPLPPEEVHRRLAQVIEPKQMFRFFSRDHKAYQGNLTDDRFEVSRIIHYRNSFLPVIKGDIRPGLGGSVVDITMQPHPFVIAFMAVWFSFSGVIFAGILCTSLVSIWQMEDGGLGSLIGVIIPAGFVLFGYLLVMGGFKFESVKSKAFFQELFRV
jgi:hypothetical protein